MCIGKWALIAALVLSPLFWPSVETSAQSALASPQYEVDPFWPRPLPERWVTGELGGVCVDATTTFSSCRAEPYPGLRKSSRAASHEFDETGNAELLGRSSGDAGGRCTMSFDAQCIAQAGNGDGFIQKFCKLLLRSA
jgi:hypothetical protein